MKYHNFSAMNTGILLAAEGDANLISRGFRDVEDLIRRYEQRFTRFREDSELSELNRSAGIWYAASDDFFELVFLAYSAYQQTGGLYNPAILEALEQAGYDRSMDEIRGRTLQRRPFLTARGDSGGHFSQLLLDEDRREILLPLGVRIDLGGIAKGWIAEKAALRMAKYAHACLVDAGGDLFTIGLPDREKNWTVALEDPFDALRDLALLPIVAGAVATSTTTKRRWRQGGQERHHLIDPRTGQPAQSGWVSVTVTAEHAAQAEVLAKALLIGGPEAARWLLDRYPGALFIAVDRERNLWGTLESKKVFYEHNAEIIR